MVSVLAVSDKQNQFFIDTKCFVNIDIVVENISFDNFIGVNDFDCDLIVIKDENISHSFSQHKDKMKRICSKFDVLIISSNCNKDLECVLKGWGAVILKEPSGEEEIKEAIDNVVCGAKAKRAKENFEKMVLEEADRVKPIIREQFLRDYILGVGDTDEIFNIYCKTFSVDYDLCTRMIVFKPEQELDFEESFFLKNIIEGYIGIGNILLSTAIKDNILIVTSITDENNITTILEKLKNVFKRYYSYMVSIVYSGVCAICDTPEQYEHIIECLEYCFYTSGDEIIAADDITLNSRNTAIETNYCNVERAVKSGDLDKTQLLIRSFFLEVENAKLGPLVAKTYCLELYVCIIRCCEVEKIDKYMKGIMELQAFKTIHEIREYVLFIATEIVKANMPKQSKVYSSLISETLEIIEENLGNENLSLRWLAGTILYTNVDYLGKLFKKEIGENFSHYIMRKRMEMAKDLIINGKKDRIYEVAEKVGYGSNSQYFSQVFKKYTGVSPLEYKEYVRANGTISA